MSRYLNEVGGPYGRSFYPRALEVAGIVEETRSLLAGLLGTGQPERIVFAHNATHAVNIVLKGLALTGKEVWISPLEHNAVARPLRRLKQEGRITVRFLPAAADGRVLPERLSGLFSRRTGLIIVNHQSNVNGVIQPIRELKEQAGDIPVLVDAAQSLDHQSIDVQGSGIDFVAFTGHKGLLGPTGTGGLYLGGPPLKPLIEGEREAARKAALCRTSSPTNSRRAPQYRRHLRPSCCPGAQACAPAFRNGFPRPHAGHR